MHAREEDEEDDGEDAPKDGQDDGYEDEEEEEEEGSSSGGEEDADAEQPSARRDNRTLEEQVWHTSSCHKVESCAACQKVSLIAVSWTSHHGEPLVDSLSL